MRAKALQGVVGEMIQTWFMHHPLLGWGVTHPLWALGTVLALFFVLGGLLKAIAQLTEQLWIDLLQLPMWAVRAILALLLPWRKPQTGSATHTQNSPSIGFYRQTLQEEYPSAQSTNKQLCESMARLERIQQEQTLLLKDIKTLLLNNQRVVIRKKQIFLKEPSSKR